MNCKLFGAAACFALGVSATAQAACTQTNAAGTWAAYSAGTTGGDLYWFRCTLTINGAGKITAGSCTESNGQASPMGGTIRLVAAAVCTYRAALNFSKFGQTATIDQATLSLDKQAVLGVGTFLGTKFTFDMLKTK